VTGWVTDITEHPTREGKVYCAVVLDACTRRVVGWSIDSSQTAALVTSALHGHSQPHSRPGRGDPLRPRAAIHLMGPLETGPAPAGCCPRWGRSGLLRQRNDRIVLGGWCRTNCSTGNAAETRLELTNALLSTWRIFYNRRRRHSSLGMLTPIEYELRLAAEPVA
jgi:putative transposase